MQAPSLLLLSNQQALQRSMDIVANNVANTSTTAFKREGIEFDTFMMHPQGGSSRQTLNFVVDHATYRDASTGSIQPTGNQLDLAIQGKGYFVVRGADNNTHYTRNGSFQVNAKGELVTQSGLLVLTDGGQPLTLPDTTTEVNVSGDGFVTARIDNGTNLSELGKIGVVKFDSEQAMQSEGGGLYGTQQISAPATESAIVQGSLEQSNVEPITEMTTMIQIQRAYEQTANLINQENSRLTSAITTLSKSS